MADSGGGPGKGRWRTHTRAVQQAALLLRKDLTPAEEVLWEALRDRRFTGAKFRRQHAIGRFILDFYCAEAKLCVELDGAVHDEAPQRERDQARTEALNTLGIRVLRFRNQEVLAALPSVLHRIAAATEQEVRARSENNPLPRQFAGEGGEPKRAG